MKRLFATALIVAAMSAPAFAAAKNSDSLTIAEPVVVGTTTLPAADYKVTWTSTGTSQVTLSHGKTSVTVPAKVVDQKNNTNSILTDNKGGVNAIKAINLNKVSITLEDSQSVGQ